jgi:hypothetical protein
VLTHGQERLFRKVTSVSIHSFVIESGFSKASEINRNDFLEYKEKKINKRVPLVLIYHPSLRKFQALSVIIGKKLKKVCYGTFVRVAIGDSTCNACHHMV